MIHHTNESLKTRDLLVGIDPSFKTMGVCIYNPKTKKMTMKTGTMMSQIDWLKKNVDLKRVIVVVENPDRDKTTFNMWGMVAAVVENYVKYRVWQIMKNGPPPTRTIQSDVQSQFSIAMNYAQKVGKNKAAAQLIIEMLFLSGIPVAEVAPSERERAVKKVKGKKVEADLFAVKRMKMPTKTTRNQFFELTGHNAVSSEHARDAATLVYDKAIPWFIMTVLTQQPQPKQPKSFPSPANNNQFILKYKAKKKTR